MATEASIHDRLIALQEEKTRRLEEVASEYAERIFALQEECPHPKRLRRRDHYDSLGYHLYCPDCERRWIDGR